MVQGYVEAFEAIDSFQVQEVLLGATHYIPVGSGTISLILPTKGMRRYGQDCVSEEESQLGVKGSEWYGVHEIELRYELPDKIEVHPTNDEQNRLRYRMDYHALRELDDLLREAFDRWKKTFRAVTGSSIIASRDNKFEEISSRQGALRIRHKTDDATLYAAGGIIMLVGSAKITLDHWQEVQARLSQESDIPLWIEFLDEAERRFWAGDVNGAVLSAATACETVIRAVFWTHITAPLTPVVRREIDKVAVQGLLSRWHDIADMTKQEAEAAGKKSVHKLFDLRNDVIHQGYKQGSNRDTVALTLRGVRTFIENADSIIRLKSRLASEQGNDADDPST